MKPVRFERVIHDDEIWPVLDISPVDVNTELQALAERATLHASAVLHIRLTDPRPEPAPAHVSAPAPQPRIKRRQRTQPQSSRAPLLAAACFGRRRAALVVRPFDVPGGLALTASGKPMQSPPSWVNWLLWERRRPR